jgi:hypothetical protein
MMNFIERFLHLLVLITNRDPRDLFRWHPEAGRRTSSERPPRRPDRRRRAMTTMAKLLAQKQQLVEQLDAAGPHEREEIERLLEKINAALEALDEAGSGASRDDE